MHYLTKKGIIENENTGHRRVVGLDDISFKQLEKSFQVPYIRACFDHYEFFYPIGWNEGINIFNQEKDYKKFEKSVVELIKKADEKGGYFKIFLIFSSSS